MEFTRFVPQNKWPNNFSPLTRRPLDQKVFTSVHFTGKQAGQACKWGFEVGKGCIFYHAYVRPWEMSNSFPLLRSFASCISICQNRTHCMHPYEHVLLTCKSLTTRGEYLTKLLRDLLDNPIQYAVKLSEVHKY